MKSKVIEDYFSEIEAELEIAYKRGNQARKAGYDPEDSIDIPRAKGVAERVEGLISALCPQIIDSGVAKRIQELEKEYGSLDWRVALKIAKEVAEQRFFSFESNLRAMETGIRVGLAYITLGVISAPLEGFIELRLKKRRDNQKEYFSVLFAGPIRAAGGTAEAVSLIIADYVRTKLGYASFDPGEDEIKRYIAEIQDYHDRVTNLQYCPTEEEITFLVKHLPVEINGDPTEELEVSNYKDLLRVETNRIRGGMCLVLAEGLAQKASKLHKQLSRWGTAFDLKWGFLNEFLAMQKKIKAKGAVDSGGKKSGISPNFTYIKDLVAGRPVLSYPLTIGGFRLRYGRSRLSGLAAAAIHPATMQLLHKYIATGTQLKVERPGKAAAIVPCDTIEGPIIRLRSGSVLYIATQREAKQYRKEVDKILFLGDILFNYGDFSESGHHLVPAGYCPEWWIQELEKKVVEKYGEIDHDKIAGLLGVDTGIIIKHFKDPLTTFLSAGLAHKISKMFGVPLHPSYLYYWEHLSNEEVFSLLVWLQQGKVEEANGSVEKLIFRHDRPQKLLLEKIGLPHLLVNNEYIVIQAEHAQNISMLFLNKKLSVAEGKVEDYLSGVSGVRHRLKGGTFIGARMGRPEKAKQRKLKGSPHVLFPVGNEGGRLRSFQAAMDVGEIKGQFPLFYCSHCKKDTVLSMCEYCNNKTLRRYHCRTCGTLPEPCKPHTSFSYQIQKIDIKRYFQHALAMLDAKIYPDLIKGVRGTSNKDHITEHLVKGILRSKYNLYVNKDGTIRYDMIELPITHFTPKEIGVSIAQLQKMGYAQDIHGKVLQDTGQMVEIMPQDLILPVSPESPDEPCDEVLFRVTKFIDELLVKFYSQKPYYNCKDHKDLIGKLVICLAPHTSAGTIGRVIGFSKTQGMFAHPMLHAAMRRNCDGDEASIFLLMDGLLNFSRSYLPDKRGSRTMDAPLVLTSILIPKEVDDEVHGLDIVWKYPLKLYEAAQEMKYPWEVDVMQIDDVLNTPKQYEHMGYTHETSDMNIGVLCSAYKLLPSMEEKLQGQMKLAEQIEAVDETDVARLVIEKHLIRDIKGNLKKFSTQQFRCVKCNEKYRRPPLLGKCQVCGGRLIFTVSEGSIIKYLEPSLSLAAKYEVSPYLIQTMDLLKKRIEGVLGKEKERQEGLGRWFD